MSEEGSRNEETAAQIFAAHLQGLEADQEVELEALCAEHPGHADRLREIHAHWREVTGVIDVLESGQSLQDRLKRRYGKAAEPGESLDGDPRPKSDPSPSATLERLEAHAPKQSRYEPLNEIARGGMGAILKVWDTDLRRNLAMKVVLCKEDPKRKGSTLPVDDRVLGRFLEEAQITAQLDHPGIVPVHELGLDDQGRVYFTMRLVKGRDFAEILTLCKSGEDGWTQTRAVGVLLKVCEAMAYAHSKNVIHRDLKPANIMVGRFGEVYVMDWGLAKVQGREDRHDMRLREVDEALLSQVVTDRRELEEGSPLMTMDGDIVGTPSYMSPEQARGQQANVAPPSDVYSLGSILYHLCAGHMPYVPETAKLNALAVWGMLQNGAPTPLAELAPLTPPELVSITRKAMARDAADRYQDTLEMAEDLRAYLEGRVVRAHRTGVVIEMRKWVQRNQALAATAAAAVLIAIGGFAYFVRQQSIFSDELATKEGKVSKLSADLFVREMEVDALEEDAKVAKAQTDALLKEAEGDRQEAKDLLSNAQKEINRQRDEIDRRIADARRQTYVANMTAAKMNLDAANHEEAMRRLESAPVELRGWEWYHLGLSQDAALLSFNSLGGGNGRTVWGADGDVLYSVGTEAEIAIQRIGSGGPAVTLDGHALQVGALVTNPDGTRIASGSLDQTVRIWDARTGAELVKIDHPLEPTALVFTDDGERLVSADGWLPTQQVPGVVTRGKPKHCGIYVWDAKTGERLLEMKGHGEPIQCLAVHPDGVRLFSGSRDSTIRVWSLETGELLETLESGEVETRAWNAIHLSPDGALLASTEWYVTRWNLETKSATRIIRASGGTFFDSSLSSDGKRIATGATNREVTIWDATTGQPISVLNGHAGGVEDVEFSPDGESLASSSWTDGVRVWDSNTSSPVAVLEADDPRVRELPLRYPDSKGGKPSDLWVFDVDSSTIALHPVAVASPDGRWIAHIGRKRRLRKEYTVDVWDGVTYEHHAVLVGHQARISAIAFDPGGGRIATGSDDRTIRVWDVATGEEIGNYGGHAATIESVAFDPSGERLAAGFRDGRVIVRELSTGAKAEMAERHEGSVMCLAWSSDGERLASGSIDDTIHVFDPTAGRALLRLRGHTEFVACIAFGPNDDRIFSGSGDRTIRVWDALSGDALLSLSGSRNPLTGLRFTRAGNRLVSFVLAARPTVRIWDSRLEDAQDTWLDREILRSARALTERLTEELGDRDEAMIQITEDASIDPAVRERAMQLLRPLQR